jgi:predicted nucleotidyltransferase component of viral defense system
MSIAIVQEKLLAYQCQTIIEQENALKEIAQEIALLALSRSGFFQVAAFQGGTCLRILYGLERFSEDVDFVLEKPDKHFSWEKYIHGMQEEFRTYGYSLEVTERKKLEKAVKVAFLKADSAGGLLLLKDIRTNKPKLKIKLEIDTHPPEGATYELKYLDFPLPYSVKVQDMPSLFAGKCHALLCRQYIKGRDWYDFTWYVARQTPINFTLLSHAIEQVGPWQGQQITVTPKWFLHQLKIKMTQIDWNEVKQDAMRFLRQPELATLQLWSNDFFLSRLEKLTDYLIKGPS